MSAQWPPDGYPNLLFEVYGYDGYIGDAFNTVKDSLQRTDLRRDCVIAVAPVHSRIWGMLPVAKPGGCYCEGFAVVDREFDDSADEVRVIAKPLIGISLVDVVTKDMAIARIVLKGAL